MLKFFKKIRRKLLQEGNLKQYLIYALGEIILVVIGILIAFQINSWNDNRKSLRLEKQHLLNLKNEISQSLSRLETSEEFNNLTLSHIDKILYHIEEDLPYSKSLDTSFYIYQYNSIPELSYTTYETIKEVGLNSINPDKLRIEISKLYEENFAFLSNTIQNNERYFYQNILTEFHVNNFKEISYQGVCIPNNFEVLKKDLQYSNILFKLKGIRIYSINAVGQVKEKALKLLESIEVRLHNI